MLIMNNDLKVDLLPESHFLFMKQSHKYQHKKYRNKIKVMLVNFKDLPSTLESIESADSSIFIDDCNENPAWNYDDKLRIFKALKVHISIIFYT